MLAVESLGASMSWPRVVLAHGFTQNARCWGTFGRLVGDNFATVAVDAPGHGMSAHDDADLAEAGRLLIEAGGPGHYVGYSMGGRMLLHGVLDDSIGAVQSLVLIGATPGIEDDDERGERRLADLALAERVRALGTAEFIEQWLATPLFADLPDDEACRAKRCENSPDGLASSLEHCGTGTQTPLWHRLGEIEIPVLVLAGSTDTKFTAIGHRMAELLPTARFEPISGGHAAHLESPNRVAEAVVGWVTGLGSDSDPARRGSTRGRRQ